MGLTNLRSSIGEKGLPKSFRRKLDKKIDFYEKVKDTVASLAAKKAIGKKKRIRSRQKKLKAYDLSALSEFLPNLDAPKPPLVADNLKLNCKSRQKLVEKEGKNLKFVINHPAFGKDPLSAIHQHLQNTQPTVGKHDRQSASSKKKVTRKRAKGLPAGPQLMDSR